MPSLEIWGTEMKKKIIIGSIIAVVLLLLMPSIPAVQKISVEDGIKQEIQEKVETITLEDLMDIEVLKGVKHPILYFLLFLNLSMRSVFRLLLADLIVNYPTTIPRVLIGVLLLVRVVFSLFFWQNISDFLGWGWDLVGLVDKFLWQIT